MHTTYLYPLLASLVIVTYQQGNIQSLKGIVGSGGDDCECVPYYTCKNESVTYNDGGLINMKYVEKGHCDSYLDVCCARPVKTKCGVRNPEGIGFRIMYDVPNEAKYGEFPWLVIIIQEDKSAADDDLYNTDHCGGSLIHPQAVLTTAHCVTTQNKKYKIRAGDWDKQTSREIYPHQDRRVETIIVHPNYVAGDLRNDIALLILDSPFELVPNVDIICLPPKNIVAPPGTRCIVSGWGKEGIEGQYQIILKRIELPMVGRDECQKNLRRTVLGKYFELNKSFVCAGGELGSDACEGDGGSPLVCPIPGQNYTYLQIGMVSWGVGCGEEKVPSVYTNVPLYIDWIKTKLSQQNLTMS